jgi:hypothetical protein
MKKADGGYMADGGEFGVKFIIIPFKTYNDMPKNPDNQASFIFKGTQDSANKKAQKFIIENNFYAAYVKKINEVGKGLSKNYYVVSKDKIQKTFEDGGYMAKGGMLEIIKDWELKSNGRYYATFFLRKDDPRYRLITEHGVTESIEDVNGGYEITISVTKEGKDFFENYEGLDANGNQYSFKTMARGGMSQGYDDREDERLGMKDGKMSMKDLDSTHARRDDAQFEERMANGGEVSTKLKMLKEKSNGYFPNIEPTKERSYYLWETPKAAKSSFIIESRSVYSDVGSSFYIYDKDYKFLGSVNQLIGFNYVKPLRITKSDVKFEDGGYMAKGGKVLIEISTHKAVKDGDKIKIYRKELEFDSNDDIIGEKLELLYSIPSENEDDLLPIFDDFEETNRILMAEANSELRMAKGGSIRTLYKQFNQEKPNILLIMIADDVASDFMREKFDKTVDWSKLSDSEKEKYNEDYRVNKTSFENYLMSEFVKLYYSDDSIKEKCKGSSHKTIDSIKSVMKDLAKKYSQDKYAKGGISQKEVAESNAEMVLSQIKAVKHHAQELSNVVSKNSDIEAWVVAKIERASTDLSDITHYLEFQTKKMAMGGEIHRTQD